MKQSQSPKCHCAFSSRPVWALALTLSFGSCVQSSQRATEVDVTDEASMVRLVEAAFRHVISDISGSSQLPPGQDSLKVFIENPPSHVRLSPMALKALATVASELRTPSAKGPTCHGILNCTMERGTVSIALTRVAILDNNLAEVGVATSRRSPSKSRIFMTASRMLFEWNGVAWTWIKNTSFLIT